MTDGGRVIDVKFVHPANARILINLIDGSSITPIMSSLSKKAESSTPVPAIVTINLCSPIGRSSLCVHVMW